MSEFDPDVKNEPVQVHQSRQKILLKVSFCKLDQKEVVIVVLTRQPFLEK